jgi:hypothetical protein
MTYKYTFNTKQIEKISFYLMQTKKNKITILEIGSRDAADAFYLSSILKINHEISISNSFNVKSVSPSFDETTSFLKLM